MSSSSNHSSNGYSTKALAVSEKGAGRQGDCVPGIGDKLRKQLGIGPESRRVEGSEPLAALPQGIKGAPFNCGILKEIILDQSNTVKIRPVLLTVSGLQESGDTHAITHLMKHYVDKSPYTPISRKTYIPKTANGIINYKLVAVGLHRLQIVEMTSDFSYAFGIMSAFQKKVQDKENPEFPLIDSNTRSEKNASFDDPDLEMHLENVYRHISQFEHFPKGGPTQSDKSVESIIDKLTGEEKALLQHLQKLPDGAALINIWSVDIRKSAFYILHALFGYLYNSNTWLFLDIQQDLKELDVPPEDKRQQQTDGSFIVKWRSRLHYLLRASKMSHGGIKGDRTQVCTFFAKHDKGNLQIKQDELEEKVHQGARQTGVSDLLEPQVQVISYLNDSQISDDDSQRLYQKFHQVISNRAYKEIPFSWVFLRSLFYCSHKIYISKTALKEKAKDCGIIDKSFEEFCHFFMSFGSIIDLTCINPEQQIIVLAPVEFLRSLDKIFHPSDEISKRYLMISNGVVSDKVCKEIFEQEGEWAVYIDVLMSIGLAAKVTRDCELKDIKLTPEQRNDALYYIPLIRKEVISSPDEIQGANNAVYFITSPDSPHIYKQARLAKFILTDHELAHSELIPCQQRNKTIIRVVYGYTDTTITFVSFSPATLITITENNESKSNHDELFKIYTRVIKAFNDITKTGEAGLIKYQFITICSKKSKDSEPPHQHVLPNNSLCELCRSDGRLTGELTLWNEVLEKNPIPDENKINEELTYTQISFIAHEAESHPELIPDLIEVLGCSQKDDPKYKELKGGKLMMQMIMDWEKAYNTKSQEEGARRALARKLYEKSIELKHQALSTDHDKRTKAIQRMANNLDIYFDPEALS